MTGFKRILVITLCLIISIPLGFRFLAHQREHQDINTALPNQGEIVKTQLGDIYILEEGKQNNNPILFAHGTAAWSELWHPTLNEVSLAGFRAIAFDMPPFGYSERASDNDYSRQKQAMRLIELVKSLEIKPILVAHSFGAGPSVEAVMRSPDLFSGLIIVDGAVGLDSHKENAELPIFLQNQTLREFVTSLTASNPFLAKTFLRSLIYKKSAATNEIIAILQKPTSRINTTSSFAAWLPSLIQPPINAKSTRRSDYKKLNVPTILIWGDKDSVTPLSQGEALHKLINGSELIILTDVGHIPQIEAPKMFQNALVSAIKSISSRK